MNYIKIGGMDWSSYCNKLTVITNKKYNAQTNAAGDTVIDYINSKRTIEVGFIHMDLDNETRFLLEDIVSGDNVYINFLNPVTNKEEQINCYVGDSTFDYYTIRDDKLQIKPFTVKFVEL